MNERLLNPISTSELERRWEAVRKAMVERNIEALIMQNNNDWLGGYVRWFTDTPLSNGYPRTVIFPIRDLMTLIDMGLAFAWPATSDPAPVPGVVLNHQQTDLADEATILLVHWLGPPSGT